MEAPGAGLTLEGLWATVQALEATVRALEARVRQLEEAGGEFRLALNRLGDALAATHDRPAMLSSLLETCALYLRAPAAVFYGVVAGSNRLRPLATTGDAAGLDRLGELQPGEGLAGRAAADGKVVVWPDEGQPAHGGPAGGGPAGGGPAGPDRHADADGHDSLDAPPAPSPAEPFPAATTAVAVPVQSGGRPFGVLAVYGRTGGGRFAPDDVDALATLVRQAETAIENTFLYEEATRLSITDGLTSLWNRRQFDLRLQAEQQRSIRFGEPFSVVLLDLDQLKSINDSHGHQAGDAVLIELAHRVTSAIRDVDLVARFGGDEFGLILPNTGLSGALHLATKVRDVISDRPFEIQGVSMRVTVSAGAATYPEHGSTARDLVAAADAALYRAKAAGGDSVEHAKVKP